MAFVVSKRGDAGPPRGPQRRVKEAKPLDRPRGVLEICLWVRFGSLDCLDLASFELWLQERSKGGVPNSSLSL